MIGEVRSLTNIEASLQHPVTLFFLLETNPFHRVKNRFSIANTSRNWFSLLTEKS